VLLAGAWLACAPTGWQRTDRRSCAEPSPPVVCVQADPDRPLEIRVGGQRLVPGECAAAPERTRGATRRLEIEDGQGDRRVARVRLPADSITHVVIDEHGRARVDHRQACDGRVPADPEVSLRPRR
jgi:hypothetical protein